MKYGKMAENENINASIYRCFGYIGDVNAEFFVSKFKEQRHNTQVMHTFRELILGAYLVSKGFNVKYEHHVDCHTPDWVIFDNFSKISTIIELTNFHAPQSIETEIQKTLNTNRIWTGWLFNEDRLYQSILHKAGIYKKLVEKYCLPYVISVFSEFTAAVDLDELNACLFGDGYKLFTSYPSLSGVLLFYENYGTYKFTYIQNPHANNKFHIEDGAFL